MRLFGGSELYARPESHTIETINASESTLWRETMRYTALEREVEIRALRPTDAVEEIDRLFHTPHALMADFALRRYSRANLGEGKLEEGEPAGETYVAESESGLIGAAVFFDPENTRGCPFYDRPGVASLGPFAIQPAFQGHGLGSAMLSFLETRARETGADELAVELSPNAPHSLNKFLKEGYRYAENANWADCGQKCVILHKPLS